MVLPAFLGLTAFWGVITAIVTTIFGFKLINFFEGTGTFKLMIIIIAAVFGLLLVKKLLR